MFSGLNIDITIWIDDGDGVFDKTYDKQFKLYTDSRFASQPIFQHILFMPSIK